MDAQVFAIWFVLPIVLLIEAAVVRFAWRGENGHFLPDGVERGMDSLAHNWGGIAVIVAAWLGLTLVAWAYEFAVGFVLVHLVLFSLGRVAAAIGLGVFALIMAITPVLLARLALKIRHHKTETPRHLPAVRA